MSRRPLNVFGSQSARSDRRNVVRLLGARDLFVSLSAARAFDSLCGDLRCHGRYLGPGSRDAPLSQAPLDDALSDVIALRFDIDCAVVVDGLLPEASSRPLAAP